MSEKSVYTYNVVNTLGHSCLIGSSSFVQVTRTTIKYRMNKKFGQTQEWTVELAAIDCLQNLLLENYSEYFDDLLALR